MAILPEAVRERMGLLIVTAMGLFLALQYNFVIGEVFATYLPAGEALWAKAIYLIILTLVVVYIIVLVERFFGRR